MPIPAVVFMVGRELLVRFGRAIVSKAAARVAQRLGLFALAGAAVRVLGREEASGAPAIAGELVHDLPDSEIEEEAERLSEMPYMETEDELLEEIERLVCTPEVYCDA